MRILKNLIYLCIFITIITTSSITVSADVTNSYHMNESEQRYIYERKDVSAFMKVDSFKCADSPIEYDKDITKPMLYNVSELESITTLDNVKKYDIYSYVIEDDEITIIGCDNTSTAISVPSSIRGYAVTKIDDFAFEWCDAIPSIYIPDTVTSIGKGAFRFCLNLEEIIVSEEHPTYKSENGVLYNKNKSTIVCFPANSSIDNNSLLEEITVIDDFAFWGSNIKYISLSESISYIGTGAFGCCASLENINVDDKNTSYSSVNGILYDKALNEILCMPGASNEDILDTVTIIGAYSFCGSIREAEYQFSNINIVKEYAFAYCENLISIEFDDILDEIHEGAFLNCYYVTNIDLANGVTSIGEDCFWQCQYIEEITLGSKVTCIPSGSFGYCLSLGKVDLNDNITEIGEYAFFSCEALEKINLKSVMTIGKGAFACCVSISSLDFPSTTSSIGEYAMYWCNTLTRISVDTENDYYCSIDDNLFNKNADCLIQYALWNSRESYIVPNDVTTIKKSAFENASQLTQITLPVSIMTIEEDAFEWCDNLQYIYYNGSESDYYNIDIHNNPFLKNIQIIFNIAENPDDIKPILFVNSSVAIQSQTIDVTIDLLNNPGVALIGFNVNYDSNAMTLKSATLCDIFKGELDCNLLAVPFVFNVYSGTENNMLSGELVKLQFEINENCPEGNYYIELSNIELINIDENNVDYEYTNGTVQVKSFICGDVTSDGTVNRKDLLRLAMYFSGFDVEINEVASDVTDDGEVNRKDLLRLVKYFSGFDVTLGK